MIPGDNASDLFSEREKLPDVEVGVTVKDWKPVSDPVPEAVQVVDEFDEFYDEIVVFKVENTFFRAFKKAFLSPGSFFQALFALPVPDTSDTNVKSSLSHPGPTFVPEGTSAENPIILHRISKDHFRSFLKVLSPFEGVPPCTTYTEWKGVLYLSTMWEFPTIRQKAIKALTPLLKSRPIADRILVSFKYEVKDWFIEAIVDAVLAPKGIDRRRLKKAGVDSDTISGLLAVRDTVVQQQIGHLVSSLEHCRKQGGHLYIRGTTHDQYASVNDWRDRGHFQSSYDRVRPIVMEEFADELKRMRDD
ncbi:hypothetical protein CVT24_010916 [Panaeolus cyanescens]|uniref:BTB domain-containing protein n=1 Tax=Panaeolus cyanescens TaxID=181874 RepID=A0A409YVN5_9AGAR|nr:hypothetical protein CVT24_010916 [Panaeolus cyanescens]